MFKNLQNILVYNIGAWDNFKGQIVGGCYYFKFQTVSIISLDNWTL